MVKIRLVGTTEEVKESIEKIEKSFEILSISDDYKNRNSKYIRVYIDAK